MKKEKANAPAQKQSVNDFAHRLTIQLTEQHYVDYAMTHSQDQIQKGRKRAILWAVLFTILGLVAIYKGTFTEGWLSDIYLIAGILMIVFQIFNLRSLLSEKSKEFSLLLYIEIFQFSHNITDQFSNLTQILCLYILKSCIRKVRHFFLGSCTILKDLVSILNINLCSKIIYHFLFFRCQYRHFFLLCLLFGEHFFFLFKLSKIRLQC